MWKRTIVGIALVSGLVVPASAAASHTRDGRVPGQPDFVDNGYETQQFDPATRRYFVRRKGSRDPAVTMHLDPPPTLATPGSLPLPVPDANPALVPLPGSRDAPVCATSPSHRIVVVYTYPENGTNRGSTLAPDIRSIIERLNYKLIQESKRSSAPSPYTASQYRISCTSSGTINVSVVAVHAHNGNTDLNHQDNIRFSVEGHEAIGATPRHAGLAGAFGAFRPSGSSAIKYAVFHDGPNPGNVFSGVAWGFVGESTDAGYWRKSSSDSFTPGVANYNRIYTTTAVAWREPPGFREIWHSHVMMHELDHVMGGSQAFQPGTLTNPWATAGAHCTDGNDVLCYNDGSGPNHAGVARNGTLYSDTRCANGRFNLPEYVPNDCRYDTYFDTEPESGTFLLTNWNVGGAENPFLFYSSSTIDPTP